MAIIRKRPTDFKPSAVKEFTDRVEPRRAFWKRYKKMTDEGSTIITFYGAGGVGKTTLLKKLEDEIKNINEGNDNKIKYVKYDLNISTDLREVLKTFKFQLAAYDCNFPLFDIGNYYYSLKTGQDITPLKAKSMMEKIPWLKEVKSKIQQVDKTLGKATPVVNTAKMFFEITNEVLQAIPVTRAITTCFSVADTLLTHYMESRQILDDEHKELHNQLKARRYEKNPVQLYEYLPILFAQDVTDWMQATGNKLVVLFDNYESLISATSFASEEQLKRDLWLRGDMGLIFLIPDTLWTIAGRNKLRWGGELADELEQHLIKALSPEDSNWFLKRAGVENETLRGELVRLTEGYPIFLDLCVDVYAEYKRRYGKEPTIKEFGQKRQEVVARIFRYLDADKDDVAKDMLEFLCVLNVWTDELAVNIGEQALHNFSRNTYKRVKNFSFIQAERVENESLDLTFYRFDRTIQSIIIANCDQKLIDDVIAATNNYFQKFFADNTIFDAQNIFYLKLWAEFIICFATDSDSLREQYENTLAQRVDALIDFAEFDSVEDILNLFMSKIENLNEAESVPYEKFEVDLGWLRRAQGKYREAYEITNSAYEKLARLLGEKHPDTLDAMNNLALMLSDLGRYDNALTMQEKVLALRKEILGENHPDTIGAIGNLALTLSYLGHYDDALNFQEKALKLFKKILGEKRPDTLDAMNNLALTLIDLGRYEEALQVQEKVLTLRKEISGENHLDTLDAMNNLALTLNALGRYEEALQVQEKVLTLRKEILGENHPDTLLATNHLASTLSYLGRYDEALKVQEKILTLRKEILGENHPDTLDAMNNLALTLNDLGHYEEALEAQEKILTLRKEILGEKHPDTLLAMDCLAGTLSGLGRYNEALTLQEKILDCSKEILGERHPDTLLATNNLAWTLFLLKRYNDALKMQEKVLPLFEEILGKGHPNTLRSMNNLTLTLSYLGRYEEALEQQEKILSLHKEILGEEHPITVDDMLNLAGMLLYLARYDEALTLLEKVFRLSKENIGEKHFNTLSFLDNETDNLIDKGLYDAALILQQSMLEICEENFGYNHLFTILATAYLADKLYKCGEREEAIQLVEDALAKAQENFGEDEELIQEISDLHDKILNNND